MTNLNRIFQHGTFLSFATSLMKSVTIDENEIKAKNDQNKLDKCLGEEE